MAFRLIEQPRSRPSGDDPAETALHYKAIGEQNENTVRAYATIGTPPSVFTPMGILYRKGINVEPDGWQQYLVTVPYGPGKDKVTGQAGFSFDTTGATINIKAAKEHIKSYDATAGGEDDEEEGDSEDGEEQSQPLEWHRGAINVKNDGDVEGTDIVIPALKMTYTFKHPLGIVDEEFARNLAGATGFTNKYKFRGFQPDELLFIGGTGSDGTDAEAEVAYQMVASKNVTDLRVGEIRNIMKKGHHFLWVQFEDAVRVGEAVRQPKRVHIDRVYDPIDFAAVFGWE